MVDTKVFNYYISFMIYLIAIFTLFPSLAWAGNINIPTIVLTERLMLYSFVLVVGLEAWVIYKRLPNLTKKQSFFVSLKSNLITMFLVVPLVWGIWSLIRFNIPMDALVILGKLTFNSMFVSRIIVAPWTIDTESLLLAEWIMAPVYFITSYYVEYWFSRKKLKDFDPVQVKKSFFYANLYSYIMIMALETIFQFINPTTAQNFGKY